MSGTDYTQTTNYGLYKPLPNADINQWGAHLNSNADTLDSLIHNTTAGVNVRSYGAKGDGITNDTAAFNAAMAAGMMVRVPTGLYLIDPITIPAGVALCGTVPGPMDPSPGFLTTPIGATLLINSHALPFITLNTSSGLFDVIIYDPNQVAPTASAPNVFPAAVLMSGVSRMRGVTICNAYVGIQVHCGRCFVENCYIGAYNIAVDTDLVADVVYFCNIWCGVFYDTCLGLFPWQNMDNWVINNNGIGFRFGRADAVSMINCGSFIKWAGIYIIDGTGSVPGQSYGWCANHNTDICVYGAVIYSTNAASGWQFTNFTALASGAPQPQGVSPLYMPTGGVSAPIVSWVGGAIGIPTAWVTPAPIVNAGVLTVVGVGHLPDRLAGNGAGFNGAQPVAKPTVSGSKGANAALASLMSALAASGLVVDTTT